MSDLTFSHPMWARVDRSGGPSACWPFTGRATSGAKSQYGLIGRLTAHRKAFEVYYGMTVPPDLVVRHDCDTPKCCNPRHLRVGTPADNARDAVVRGLLTHKLSLEAVRAIYASTERATETAARHGVSLALVHHIRAGRRWAHVTGATPRSGRRWTHVPDAPGGAR